ncbi:MAG: hypothetical protein R3D65_12760 [Zhengella sp.]|uniref:hypothetical protein n=1 Tax=Zhengella sp. TaxID=2282762 RepID=UPI001D758413|nr:hypothetical protein [Notoacmeibacter sp.]MCC0027471.1 hypothetical protein [Brucellaceae bacterium]
MQGVNDNPVLPVEPAQWRAAFSVSHTAFLAPAIGVAVVFLGTWFLLWLAGQGTSPIARLALLGGCLASPVLAAHGMLAAASQRVQLLSHALVVEQGVTAPRRETLGYGFITGLSVRTSLNGRLTGSGSLVLELGDGGRVVVSGLRDAVRARDAVTAMARHRQPAGRKPSGTGLRLPAAAVRG